MRGLWIATVSLAVLVVAAPPAGAADQRPASPRGTASAQVGGSWNKGRYKPGKWLDIEAGRPIARGRPNLWGQGGDYGKTLNGGAPIWRAGADQTTQLTIETPIVIGGTTLAPGTYALFIDLKESGWTLVVSNHKRQDKGDPKNTGIWGSFGYDTKHDVVRVPMKLETLPHSFEQLAWAFIDVTDKGGRIALLWDTKLATADFQLPPPAPAK